MIISGDAILTQAHWNQKKIGWKSKKKRKKL
jgi:hypothetical protein